MDPPRSDDPLSTKTPGVLAVSPSIDYAKENATLKETGKMINRAREHAESVLGKARSILEQLQMPEPARTELLKAVDEVTRCVKDLCNGVSQHEQQVLRLLAHCHALESKVDRLEATIAQLRAEQAQLRADFAQLRAEQAQLRAEHDGSLQSIIFGQLASVVDTGFNEYVFQDEISWERTSLPHLVRRYWHGKLTDVQKARYSQLEKFLVSRNFSPAIALDLTLPAREQRMAPAHSTDAALAAVTEADLLAWAKDVPEAPDLLQLVRLFSVPGKPLVNKPATAMSKCVASALCQMRAE